MADRILSDMSWHVERGTYLVGAAAGLASGVGSRVADPGAGGCAAQLLSFVPRGARQQPRRTERSGPSSHPTPTPNANPARRSPRRDRVVTVVRGPPCGGLRSALPVSAERVRMNNEAYAMHQACELSHEC